MKILRTAVLGLGRAGWKIHIPELIKHKNYMLTAVADPLEERLDEAKSRLNVRVYRTCEQLFASEKLDLIVIASPTHFHLEQAIAAFENSVDVLCDKPVAASLDETDRMIESMRKHKKKCMVYQPHRTYSDIVSLQAILNRDLIGPVYMIKRAWCRYRVRVDWQAFRRYGGGELSNSGAHFIDQLLYLSGSRAKHVTCFLRRVISEGDAEDVAKILIETENGLILDLDITMAAALPIPAWQILGGRGAVVWDDESASWHIRYYQKDEFTGMEIQNNLAATNRSYGDDQVFPFREERVRSADYKPIVFYDKAYDYFAGGTRPFIPIEETREIMRIIEICRKNHGFFQGYK